MARTPEPTSLKINPGIWVSALLLLFGAMFGFQAGKVEYERAVAADRLELQTTLKACDSQSHPISDAAWDMYRQGMVTLDVAGYYSSIVHKMSDKEARCLRETLPLQWKGRNTSWQPPADGPDGG